MKDVSFRIKVRTFEVTPKKGLDFVIVLLKNIVGDFFLFFLIIVIFKFF